MIIWTCKNCGNVSNAKASCLNCGYDAQWISKGEPMSEQETKMSRLKAPRGTVFQYAPDFSGDVWIHQAVGDGNVSMPTVVPASDLFTFYIIYGERLAKSQALSASEADEALKLIQEKQRELDADSVDIGLTWRERIKLWFRRAL